MSYYQTSNEIPRPLNLDKLKKMPIKIFQKNLKKLQWLAWFCVFVFVVQNDRAHKTAITSTFVSQKPSIYF